MREAAAEAFSSSVSCFPYHVCAQLCVQLVDEGGDSGAYPWALSSSFFSRSLVSTAILCRTVNPSARRFDKGLSLPARLSSTVGYSQRERTGSSSALLSFSPPSHDAGGNEKARVWHRGALLFWPWAYRPRQRADWKAVLSPRQQHGSAFGAFNEIDRTSPPLRLLVGRGLVSPTAVFPSDWNEPVVPARFPVRFGFGSRRNRNRNSGTSARNRVRFVLFSCAFPGMGRPPLGQTSDKDNQDQREPPRRF